MIVGGSLLFCADLRVVTDPCDGGRSAVCLVTRRAVVTANIIAYMLLLPRWIAAEDE